MSGAAGFVLDASVALGAFYDVQDLFDASIGWVQKDGFLLPLRTGETRLLSLKPI